MKEGRWYPNSGPVTEAEPPDEPLIRKVSELSEYSMALSYEVPR